jgi:4-hydroxybenzoate polyprenyltransferase
LTETTPLARTLGSVITASIRQLRPKQWTKNGFLFAALVFSGEFMKMASVEKALLGFMSFCLISSAGYVLNDYLDREADRSHPTKKNRPIASGALPVPLAWVIMWVCFVAGASLAGFISDSFLGVAALYLLTTLSYSLLFKNTVILDVMMLALCFVWRAVAGAVAIGVEASPWLILCTAFLALFLGFNKRRAELVNLGPELGTRKSLSQYSESMLEQYQSMVTGATVLCYALYTVNSEASDGLLLTIPWVLYGIFRYIYLVDQRGEGAAPDETLLQDRPLLLTAFGYVLTAVLVVAFEQLPVAL